MNVVYIFLFFILGTVLGSFYNVVGFRLPIKEEIVIKRSHCPKCKHELRWYELIPIISYIIQGGKCRKCKGKISIFYPFVELCSGVLFSVSFYSFGFSHQLIIACTLVSILMIILVSDLNFMIIPDSVLVVASIIIIITLLFATGIKDTLIAIGSGLLSFGVMYAIMKLGNLAFKRESLGGGDVKLMFISGLTLHPLLALFSIFLSSILALPTSILLLHTNKEHVLPFGPFIALAILILYFMKIDITQVLSVL